MHVCQLFASLDFDKLVRTLCVFRSVFAFAHKVEREVSIGDAVFVARPDTNRREGDVSLEDEIIEWSDSADIVEPLPEVGMC
jgi:hypothetical protein